MLIKRLLLNAFKLVGIPTKFGGVQQSGQMGRAVNPLTSVFESSNLSPSTKLKIFNNEERDKFGYCGCSSMVER